MREGERESERERERERDITYLNEKKREFSTSQLNTKACPSEGSSHF
jgi:hypothetical protein